MKFEVLISSLFTILVVIVVVNPIILFSNDSALLFVGQFHPLLLHIPIGVLIGVFLLEVLNIFYPKLKANQTSGVLLWIFVISIIPTIIAGFILSFGGGYHEEILKFHKNLGLATVVLGLWLIVLRKWIYQYKKGETWMYQTVLLITIVAISFTGHYGGTLTHGSDYLTKNMPSELKSLLGIPLSEYEVVAEKIKVKENEIPENQINFIQNVQPLLSKYCYECHNDVKQKGDTRLDVLNWDMEKSHHVQKWQDVLVEIQEKSMPPKGKSQFTEEERKQVLGWINSSLKRVPKKTDSIVKITRARLAALNNVPPVIINTSSPQAKHYATNIQPIMAKYCYSCHGAKKQKGNMRLDVLNWNMTATKNAEKWHAVLNEINTGEMPPKGKPQFNNIEREKIVNWITTSLQKITEAKTVSKEKALLKLTKQQYTSSLNNILGLQVDFGKVLPDDGKSKMGFSNSAGTLQTSSLHLDYYQKIARKALDKAIVFGKKPTPKRYKITFGEKIGAGHLSTEFKGFQSVPLSSASFKVDILDENGAEIIPTTPEETTKINTIKKSIGVGMRGSNSQRYSITNNGLVLYSVLPGVERVPKIWQGPSPNVHMLIQNVFPEEGDFSFTVTASKGKPFANSEGLVNSKNLKPIEGENTLKIVAKDFNLLKNMKLLDEVKLSTVKTSKIATAKSVLNVLEEGIYQIDMEHPYINNKKSSVEVYIGILKKIKKKFQISKKEKDIASVVTPISLVYLKKGKYTLGIRGKSFVGINELRFTILNKESEIVQGFLKKAKENEIKYRDYNPSMNVFLGTRTDDGMGSKNLKEIKEVTSPLGDYKEYKFTGSLENYPTPQYDPNDKSPLANIFAIGLWNNFLVKKDKDSGPPLLIKSIELEAPYYEVWPPKSYTDIFFESKNSDKKEVYTKEILKRFTQKAFRKTIESSELDRYVNFWKTIKDDYPVYQDSVKEVLIAILCSPKFLFLLGGESKDADFQSDQFLLASKLSYFLWNAPPDEELMQLSKQGILRESLIDQVKRMVQKDETQNMIQTFSKEWLRMDRLKTMNTNVKAYPDFSRFVKEDMFTETYSFIDYLLKENMSVLNLVDSDFAMLNQNLAEFYGIKGVFGNNFRPVAIVKEKNRGGLLSQGAFLAGHSDGEQAHPIKRAVWLKEKILGDPPPPAPPNVPELPKDNPDFEKLTLKQQLEMHRNKPSCISCHKKIDPYGIVFENYDAVGRFKKLDKNGKPIDASSVLPDGSKIQGVKGIKNYILTQKKKAFVKSLTEHLFAYAVRRDVNFTDEKEINSIVSQVVSNGYRFQTLINQIVLSRSFLESK